MWEQHSLLISIPTRNRGAGARAVCDVATAPAPLRMESLSVVRLVLLNLTSSTPFPSKDLCLIPSPVPTGCHDFTICNTLDFTSSSEMYSLYSVTCHIPLIALLLPLLPLTRAYLLLSIYPHILIVNATDIYMEPLTT